MESELDSSNFPNSKDELLTHSADSTNNITDVDVTSKSTNDEVIELKDDVTDSVEISGNDRPNESDNDAINDSIEEVIIESKNNEDKIIDSKNESMIIDDVIVDSENDAKVVSKSNDTVVGLSEMTKPEDNVMEEPKNQMGTTTTDNIMSESKNDVMLESVDNLNTGIKNDVIIDPSAKIYTNEDLSQKMKFLKKKSLKKTCPFCGKMVRNTGPSLNSEFLKTPIRIRGKIRVQSRDRSQLKAHIYEVKHELIHSEGLAMTRKLMHILKCLKMTLKKLERQ